METNLSGTIMLLSVQVKRVVLERGALDIGVLSRVYVSVLELYRCSKHPGRVWVVVNRESGQFS